MDTTKHLIPLSWCLLLLSTYTVDAKNRNSISSTVDGPMQVGNVMRQGGRGGFGGDALCALCMRIGNYQCIMRFCSGGFGGFGGFGGMGGMAGMGGMGGSGGMGFYGGGGVQPQPTPWNPTCAMCTTDACRRLWCASGFVIGRAGTGNGLWPGNNNFIRNDFRTGGRFRPVAYYPNNYGVSTGSIYGVTMSKYRKY